MWPFTHRLEALTEADLQRLIAAGVRESTTLEFKREMYRRNAKHTREMLRDVAAMANAEGGVLIIGMKEDGQGTAQQLIPVPDAEAEANRLVQLCLAHISERIPGLQARPVPINGGDVVVVRVPRSYRRPHMITFEGVTDFWVRHDRQKSRMSVAELRTAVMATEDAEMKAQRFGKSRIANALNRRAVIMLGATPLLLEDGRVSVDDARLPRLLRQPPTFRPLVGAALSTPLCDVHPTLRGLAGVTPGIQELEIFRNGHVEFLRFQRELVLEQLQGLPHPTLLEWVVAEYIRNFMHFVAALRDITEIVDPYVVRVAVFNCRGVTMAEAGFDVLGHGNIKEWSEGDHLILDPIITHADEAGDRAAQRIADRFWNAFHFNRCPFFLEDGRFHIPGR